MASNNHKIRLLLIIDDANLGGGQKHLFWLAKYLDRQKCEITAICGGTGYLTQQLRAVGITFTTFPSKIGPRDILRLRRIIRKTRPDVVHTHGTIAGVWGRLATLRMGGPKLVHTLHGIHYLHYPRSLKKLVGVWTERILSLFTAKVICVSRADRNQGLARGLFPREKTVVIHNAVEKISRPSYQELARLRQELGFSSENLIIGSVGRLRREKGPIYLLEAAHLLRRELPQARFVFVGEGPLAEFLKSRTKELGLEEQVLFLGAREDVPLLLYLLDILVLSSLWEGLPLIILEALQAGRTIIASRIESLEEIITDQREGVFFSIGSAEELAQKIRELAHDPPKRKVLGDHASRRAADFDLEEMIEKYEALYLSVFNEMA